MLDSQAQLDLEESGFHELRDNVRGEFISHPALRDDCLEVAVLVIDDVLDTGLLEVTFSILPILECDFHILVFLNFAQPRAEIFQSKGGRTWRITI